MAGFPAELGIAVLVLADEIGEVREGNAMKAIVAASAILIFLLASAQVAAAGVLAVVSGDLICVSEGKYTYTLGLRNEDVSESLLAWQLLCQIVPHNGSNGLTFLGVRQPVNYVFDAESMGLAVSETSTPTSLTISDVANNSVSVATTGTNLLQLDFDASQAIGQFDLVLVPDMDSGSFWLSDQYNSYEWHIPGSASGVVSTLSFPVPEPSQFTLMLASLLLVLIARRTRTLR